MQQAGASITDDVVVPRELELPSERLERELRALIDQLESGAKVPSLRELAESLPGAGASGHSSKKTVGKIVTKLVGEGVLTTRDRWGTFKS